MRLCVSQDARLHADCFGMPNQSDVRGLNAPALGSALALLELDPYLALIRGQCGSSSASSSHWRYSAARVSLPLPLPGYPKFPTAPRQRQWCQDAWSQAPADELPTPAPAWDEQWRPRLAHGAFLPDCVGMRAYGDAFGPNCRCIVSSAGSNRTRAASSSP